MKSLTKIILVTVMISMLVLYSLPANALTSTVYVSAGTTGYTNDSSTASKARSKCDITLEFVQFSYYPPNNIPSTYYVYAWLSTSSGHAKATSTAAFSSLSAQYPSYYLGYGGEGTSYVLASNTDLGIYFSARFDWTANGQAV